MNAIKIPAELKKMDEIFSASGHKAYLVGGAVRDVLLGKEAHDWDVATDASPEQVISIFKKVIPTGIAHGTVTVHFMKKEIEVTTFRTEAGYSDGRHPDKIAFTSDLNEDLSRRDFTMNAIAAGLKDGKIVDPFGGENDIKGKIIRTVGKPKERFEEDGLRPVRAIRFASQLGFEIEKDTYSEIFKEDCKRVIEKISLERFRDEFLKMMKSPKPSVALKMLEETGLLELFIPEMKNCRGCVQSDGRGFHDFDVMDHLFYSCDGAPQTKPLVRIAALLHDIGKPAAKKIKAGNITFYGHENIGRDMSKEILTRLKFSNAEIEAVSHLIEMHMFHYESSWTDAAVRRFVIKAKKECIEDLFDLRLSDVYGMHNAPVRLHDSATGKNLSEFSDRIKIVIEKGSALSLKDMKINGRDLIENGIPAGKILGNILGELFELITESPEMNEKEKLLPVALNIWHEKYGR